MRYTDNIYTVEEEVAMWQAELDAECNSWQKTIPVAPLSKLNNEARTDMYQSVANVTGAVQTIIYFE